MMVEGASAAAPILRVKGLDVRFRIPGGVTRADGERVVAVDQACVAL